MQTLDKRSLEFFKNLIDAPGPSGFEEIAREVWRAEVSQFADSITTGMNGSEHAMLKGKSSKFSIALFGHIDHIGLIVRYIDDDGFLYCSEVGGVDPDTVISNTVRLIGPKGVIHGVAGKVATHLQTKDDREKKLKLHEIWIDIGAKSKAEAEEYAPVGTPASIGEGVMELLNNRISGRIDNRYGAFVAAEVLRRLSKHKNELLPTVHAIASTQEETPGLYPGALSAAYNIQPSAGIAIDVNHAMDIPGADKRREGDMKLGGGAILTFGVATNNKMANHVWQIAKEKKIPIQRDVESGRHATDADVFPISRAGIPGISLGTPLRYMHNTVELADLSDIQASIEIIVEYLLSLKEAVDYTP